MRTNGMPVCSIEGCFDRRSFRLIKVDSIEDKTQFNQSVLNLLSIKSIKYFAWQWIKERRINSSIESRFLSSLTLPSKPLLWSNWRLVSIEWTLNRNNLRSNWLDTTKFVGHGIMAHIQWPLSQIPWIALYNDPVFNNNRYYTVLSVHFLYLLFLYCMFQAFVLLVIGLTTSVVVIYYAFLLPVILEYSTPWIVLHLVTAHWLLINIVFHYFKVVFTSPGRVPQVIT